MYQLISALYIGSLAVVTRRARLCMCLFPISPLEILNLGAVHSIPVWHWSVLGLKMIMTRAEKGEYLVNQGQSNVKIETNLSIREVQTVCSRHNKVSQYCTQLCAAPVSHAALHVPQPLHNTGHSNHDRKGVEGQERRIDPARAWRSPPSPVHWAVRIFRSKSDKLWMSCL